MASDLLVGQFARLIKDIVTNPQKIENNDLDLLKNMFSPRKTIFEQKPTMWYFKFSTDTWNVLCSHLNSNHFILDKSNHTQILRQHFNKCIKS